MCRKVQITTTKSYQNDVRKSEWTQFTFWIHVPGVILSRLVHVIHEKIDGFSLNQASTIHCNLAFIFCHSKSRSKMGCKHCLFLYLHTFSALCLWCDETPCTLTAVMIILQFATSSLLLFCVRYSVDSLSFVCLFVSRRFVVFPVSFHCFSDLHVHSDDPWWDETVRWVRCWLCERFVVVLCKLFWYKLT